MRVYTHFSDDLNSDLNSKAKMKLKEVAFFIFFGLFMIEIYSFNEKIHSLEPEYHYSARLQFLLKIISKRHQSFQVLNMMVPVEEKYSFNTKFFRTLFQPLSIVIRLSYFSHDSKKEIQPGSLNILLIKSTKHLS